MASARTLTRATGFTLVELVIVIVLTAIVALAVAVFIRRPVEGYVALSRRAELVDAAESSLRMMARDVRRALPNSLRTGTTATTATLEVINVVEGVRYREGGPGNQTKRLSFNLSDTEFNVLGRFVTVPMGSTSAYRLAVFNLGQAGADAYAGDAVITPAGDTITFSHDTATEDHVTMPGHRFAFESPSQRMFAVDGAIRYVCDMAAGTLTRYAVYPIKTNITDAPGVAGAKVADHIGAAPTGCVFSYNPGTASREAVISIQLTLTDSGESATLLHQVHVDNVP